jgi:hypothetical protein
MESGITDSILEIFEVKMGLVFFWEAYDLTAYGLVSMQNKTSFSKFKKT